MIPLVVWTAAVIKRTQLLYTMEQHVGSGLGLAIKCINKFFRQTFSFGTFYNITINKSIIGINTFCSFIVFSLCIPFWFKTNYLWLLYYLWFFILSLIFIWSLIFHAISDFSHYLWFFILSMMFHAISDFWLKTISVLPVCVDCNKLLPQGCSVHNTEYEYMPDSPFLTRARATLPKCFTLQQTSTSEFKNLMGEFNVLFMYNQC